LTPWRIAVAAVLAALIVAPLAVPVAILLGDPAAWRGWAEAGRLARLASNTALLVGGTLALCLPVGLIAAVLLYRTDLPGRRAFRLVALLTLFVPLPLFASGWQAVLGSGGWLPFPLWNAARPAEPAFASGGSSWTPWGQGVGSAVWIHAVAALPWVILLCGVGLRSVERSLEEDALTAAPLWRVLLRVSVPRAGASVAAAALWVALQAATEITVTDVMQVRTFAEEVYTQLAGPEAVPGGGDALARAVAAAVPSVLLSAALLLLLAGNWQRNQPPGLAEPGPSLVFRLGRWRWPLAVLAGVTAVSFAVVPIGSLLWRAGLSGSPPHWSARVVWEHLDLVRRSRPGLLRDSILLALGVGLACAGMALVACWTALGTRRYRLALLTLVAVAWALPGPVIGLGLKKTIAFLLDTIHPGLLRRALWDGPSPLPLAWVDVIRFFPCAVALVWPVMRLLPADLRDAARVDGAGPAQELRHVAAPWSALACVRAALAVGVLSLGEVSAGKLVSTPGFPSFAETVFTQMHYGITNDLAARCLWLLAAVLCGGLLVALATRIRGSRVGWSAADGPARPN
jgi:iron(III) transport system permease protein